MNNKLLKSIPDQEWRALIYTVIAPYLSMCRSNPTLEQDDLEQEAWLQLMRACENYIEKRGKNCKFTSYAYTYIRNGVSAFVRGQTYRNKRQASNDDILETVEDNSNVEQLVEAHDFTSLLTDMMSPINAEIFQMRFMEGLTYREIANKFKVDERRVSFQRIEQMLETTIEDLSRRLHYENYFVH
jgi:RNA polymerase sigma factor (sigma-70 family)